MRIDGTTFPVELTITRIDVPGPPTFTGYLRNIADRKAVEAELRASRARLVEAADDARRRLERDLHDGAQQRLVELALDLRMARSRLDDEPARARELLDAALGDLEGATARAARAGPGDPPGGAYRGRSAAGAEALVSRSTVPARLVAVPDARFSRTGGGHGVLHRGRGTHERGPLFRGSARGGRGRERGRAAASRGSRRRPGRRGRRRGLWAARAGRPRGSARR